MKKLRTICLFIFIALFCINFNQVYAQQKTAYEKKVLEIKKKYIKKMWVLSGKWTQLDEIELRNADEDFVDVLFLGKSMLFWVYPSELKNLEREIKQAENLKTAVDFKREREAKAKEEQEKYEQYYKQTDAGIIKNNIQNAFEKWNKKGEFEKEADYTERLQYQSQAAFDKICIIQIKNKINNQDYNNDYYYDDNDDDDDEYYDFNSNNYGNLQRRLSIYDSEREFFMVTFKINDVEWQNRINVPIANAEKFKNDFHNFKTEINDYDWCFVGNTLCPTLVTLKDKSTKYQFPLSHRNQSEITYSFDNLKINNPYLKGYVFNYSSIKEKIRLDSLEFVQYNQKLDSIFQNYNKILLQNPYNVAKKIITNYEKIPKEGNREENFNRCKNILKTNFENLNNNFEQELKSKNPSEYYKIWYVQNPEIKIEADKKYLECRCLYTNKEKFYIDFANNEYILTKCDCRNKLYDKILGNQSDYKFINNKTYYVKDFFSKNDFDNYYNQGDDIINREINKRIAEKIIKDFDTFNDLETCNLNKEKQSAIKDYINNNRFEPVYSKLIGVFIEKNRYLNKEWVKNGQYFENKKKFYEAYISDNYKKILKENRKK